MSVCEDFAALGLDDGAQREWACSSGASYKSLAHECETRASSAVHYRHAARERIVQPVWLIEASRGGFEAFVPIGFSELGIFRNVLTKALKCNY
eukprot:4325551-Pleurochrysis_carterae.AAC.2